MIVQLNPVLLLQVKGRGRALATLAIYHEVEREMEFLCILEQSSSLEVIPISELIGDQYQSWLRRN